MVWARLDDRANSNGKLTALSDAAFRLWACGLIYCQANLTDGHIPEHQIPMFGIRSAKPAKAVEELLRSLVPGKGPLWHREDGGYYVHDYLDWNDSRAEVVGGRNGAKDRKLRFEEKRRSGTRSRTSPEHDETSVQNTTTTSTTTTELSKKQKVLSAPTSALLAQFDERHRERFQAKASFKPGKDAKLIAALWRERQGDPVSVEALIDAFFASQDRFIADAGHSVGVFVSQVPKLIGIVARSLSIPAEHWQDECKRVHHGECPNAFFHAAKRDESKAS